jgi:sugar-specific transcriptional regulator TrmB
MNEKELLSKIGLSANEAEIYTTLLKLGPLSAYEIAKRTGIYRPHVYDKLGTLAKKGLTSQVMRGKTRIFSAVQPSKILDYLKEQENEVKKDIEFFSANIWQLDKLYNAPKENTTVTVLTGIEGLKLRLNDCCTHARKEILIFGLDDAKYNEVLPTFMPQYFKHLKERGMRERVIIQKKKDAFMFDNDVTTYRFLKAGSFNPVNTFIYENIVTLVIWGTPITNVIIENADLARTYREHFEHLWEIAEKKK